MLFLGISISCIALYLGALVGLLQWTAWGLWGLGGIAFVFWCLTEFRRGNSLATVWVPLVLLILFWWIHADSQFLYWDEYSHWGVYVREMSVTHQLVTAETNAAHPDYPPPNILATSPHGMRETWYSHITPDKPNICHC